MAVRREVTDAAGRRSSVWQGAQRSLAKPLLPRERKVQPVLGWQPPAASVTFPLADAKRNRFPAPRVLADHGERMKAQSSELSALTLPRIASE
eukprot:COSAG06_NODE_388_length_16429_cov_129.962094_4_plen_93_part_00